MYDGRPAGRRQPVPQERAGEIPRGLVLGVAEIFSRLIAPGPEDQGIIFDEGIMLRRDAAEIPTHDRSKIARERIIAHRHAPNRAVVMDGVWLDVVAVDPGLASRLPGIPEFHPLAAVPNEPVIRADGRFRRDELSRVVDVDHVELAHPTRHGPRDALDSRHMVSVARRAIDLEFRQVGKAAASKLGVGKNVSLVVDADGAEGPGQGRDITHPVRPCGKLGRYRPRSGKRGEQRPQKRDPTERSGSGDVMGFLG